MPTNLYDVLNKNIKWFVILVIAVLLFVLLREGGNFNTPLLSVNVPDKVENIKREIDGNVALLEVLSLFKAKYARSLSPNQLQDILDLEEEIRNRNSNADDLLSRLSFFEEMTPMERESLLNEVTVFMSDSTSRESFIEWGIQRDADELTFLRYELAEKNQLIGTLESDLEEARKEAISNKKIVDVLNERSDSLISEVRRTDSLVEIETIAKEAADEARKEAERRKVLAEQEVTARAEIAISKFEFKPAAKRARVRNNAYSHSSMREGLICTFTPHIRSTDKKSERKVEVIITYTVLNSKEVKNEVSTHVVVDDTPIVITNAHRWYGRGVYHAYIKYNGAVLDNRHFLVE